MMKSIGSTHIGNDIKNLREHNPLAFIEAVRKVVSNYFKGLYK